MVKSTNRRNSQQRDVKIHLITNRATLSADHFHSYKHPQTDQFHSIMIHKIICSDSVSIYNITSTPMQLNGGNWIKQSTEYNADHTTIYNCCSISWKM